MQCSEGFSELLKVIGKQLVGYHGNASMCGFLRSEMKTEAQGSTAVPWALTAHVNVGLSWEGAAFAWHLFAEALHLSPTFPSCGLTL